MWLRRVLINLNFFNAFFCDSISINLSSHRAVEGKSISIDNDTKLQNASSEIDAYIQNKFELRIDGSKIKLSGFKYNLINDLVEISCSFNYNEDINKINISNNILFGVYEIQKNVVFIRVEKESKSYIFSFSDREKTFIY